LGSGGHGKAELSAALGSHARIVHQGVETWHARHRSRAMTDRDEHSASLKTLSVAVAAAIAVGIALVVFVIWLVRHGLG